MTSQAADDDAGSLVITVPEDLAECLSAAMWMPWDLTHLWTDRPLRGVPEA